MIDVMAKILVQHFGTMRWEAYSDEAKNKFRNAAREVAHAALEEAARVVEDAPFDPTIQPTGYNANVAGIAAAIRALKDKP